MARPVKNGLDYFSFDVDFFDNEKVLAISEEFGCKGESIIIRLLCAVYKNGAYCELTEILKRGVARRTPGCSAKLVEEVVSAAVRYGLFDKVVFEKFQVLTSNGIQKRYMQAKEKKQNAFIPEEYLLTDSFSSKNDSNEGVFRRKTPQSKVKESNINEEEQSAHAQNLIQYSFDTISEDTTRSFNRYVEALREIRPDMFAGILFPPTVWLGAFARTLHVSGFADYFDKVVEWLRNNPSNGFTQNKFTPKPLDLFGETFTTNVLCGYYDEKNHKQPDAKPKRKRKGCSDAGKSWEDTKY